MGQYFVLANIDKKEYISPYDLGGVAKEIEWMSDQAYMVVFLIACGDDDGGAVRGKWAGDRVILAGDYDPNRTYKLNGEQVNLYDYAYAKFKNVTEEAMIDFNAYYGEKFFPLDEGRARLAPDMVCQPNSYTKPNDYPKNKGVKNGTKHNN